MWRKPLSLFAIGFLSACSSGGDREVTFYQEIKPIIDAKCARCHVDGGIAPFALQSYEDAKAHSGVAMLAINEGVMPPWLAGDDCNDYRGDFSLTDEEKEQFNRWVKQGAPEGDPRRLAKPIEIEDLRLSRVDLSLEMAESYTPAKEPDDYRCFVIEWPAEMTATKYVTGFNALPGNLKNVHHVIAFLARAESKEQYAELDAAEEGPGYTCFGGPGGPANGWIGAWAPGSSGADLPEGLGIPIPPGSLIVLQVHYNTLTAPPGPDRTAVQVKLADSVEKQAHVQPWANPLWLRGQMPIPANEPDVSHSFAFDPTPFLMDGQPFTIHSVAFHMHTLGTHGQLKIQRHEGADTCLLDIPNWNFHWQGGYLLKEPVQFSPGDQLAIECHWDNTAENQQMVDGRPLPPRDVNWGEGTRDEMCLGAVVWSY